MQNIDVWLLITALTTSMVGALVRAFYEINNKTYTRTKLAFILITAIAIGFINYEAVQLLNIVGWVSIFGVVGGIAGISLVKAIIENLPNIVLDKVNRLLGGRNESYNSGNGYDNNQDNYSGGNQYNRNSE